MNDLLPLDMWATIAQVDSGVYYALACMMKLPYSRRYWKNFFGRVKTIKNPGEATLKHNNVNWRTLHGTVIKVTYKNRTITKLKRDNILVLKRINTTHPDNGHIVRTYMNDNWNSEYWFTMISDHQHPIDYNWSKNPCGITISLVIKDSASSATVIMVNLPKQKRYYLDGSNKYVTKYVTPPKGTIICTINKMIKHTRVCTTEEIIIVRWNIHRRIHDTKILQFTRDSLHDTDVPAYIHRGGSRNYRDGRRCNGPKDRNVIKEKIARANEQATTAMEMLIGMGPEQPQLL